MSIWHIELKKIFIHQKGILFIGIYFVLSITMMLLSDTPKNPDIEENRKQYTFYLNQIIGKCTKETDLFLDLEAKRLSDADVELLKIYDNYYNGIITEKECQTESGPLEALLQNKKGFELVFDQYIYIRENKNNRSFLYTNGWDGLLSNDNLDVLFILLILLLITPVFCYEYESKMDSLICTVKKGTRQYTICKIVIALLTVTILCLINFSIRYGFFHLKYGLENGDSPLQSLSYFGTSVKEITLFKSFILVSAYRLFGYLTFALLILFTSVWVRKYALTAFPCTALLLLPYYGFRLESTKYFLPGPLGFIVATGFLKGNEFKYDNFSDQMEVVFHKIPDNLFIVLFALTLIISFGMAFVIIIKHTNRWCMKRRCLGRKKISLIILLCIVISDAYGCSSINTIKNTSVYNFSSRQSFENDNYFIYVDELTTDHTDILFQNKNTGETGSIVRNPLKSLIVINNYIYGNANMIYYMKNDVDKSNFYETIDRISIIGVDTRNFNETIIYEKDMNTEQDNFLGIKLNNTPNSFMQTVNSFFLDSHNIYFIGQEKDHYEIKRVNRFTGKMKSMIKMPLLTSLAYNGKTIYYVNKKSHIVKYDVNKNTENEIPDIITRYFILTNTELLFLNRKDNQKIYSMNLDSYKVQRIVDTPTLSFHCDEDYIYYINSLDLKNYRINRDGHNGILID